MLLYPALPDFAEASVEELEAYISATQATVAAVAAAPTEYVSDERTVEALMDETTNAVAGIEQARAELAARAETEEPVVEVDAEAFAALAARAAVAASEQDDPGDEDPEEDPEEPVEPDPEALAVQPVAAVEPVEPAVAPAAVPAPEPIAAAAAPPAPPAAVTASRPAPLARPARSRAATPIATQPETSGRLPVSLTAAAPLLGHDPGEDITMLDVARMMIERRRHFGAIPPGTSGENITLARLGWSYPDGRRLGQDPVENSSLIAAVVDEVEIKAELRRRRDGALLAAGGLCAPVAPYYGLADISTTSRPVRDSLPGFSADRGGVRYARPAGLGAIDTAVGIISAEDDAAGGTFATKSCQVVECPPFQETDVAAIYHCLQFGNLPARTFPELLAQWTSLTMAAHARLAESTLLTNIDAFSTSVTAASVGLGAIGDLLPQVLAAASGMRSRHRMADDAVLRVMLPAWTINLLVSDAIRSQFERLDTDAAKLTAVLRSFNVEPTFYIDGAAGAGQVFGIQGAVNDTLLSFPGTVRWYLFPEGSFLYLDGGVLELGLVRDSVLNQTNDFQIFGESFENVAYTGVEALAITSTVCDSGATSLPETVACPISY